ncbi:hypothetical protein Ssi02_65300 [Sinosporangium siamense]|uniref:Uncharacterized protein n=1 Tax=Sinosporangium siamense TaxID=1367973 RepID=A0A919RPK5_9ACTN|nr:hypothetical protein Ssi02_65300 [Sinosporangium siamense]
MVGYPRDVGAGWLEPLLTYPGRLDVSLHIEPVPQAVAAMRLRRQLARLESASRTDAEQGRLQDFATEAAADDATDLAASLARGHGRLFKVGLYLTIHAHGQNGLAAEIERVQTLAASLLLDPQPTTFRALQGLGHEPPSLTTWRQQPLSWTRPAAGWRWALARHNDTRHLDFRNG